MFLHVALSYLLIKSIPYRIPIGVCAPPGGLLGVVDPSTRSRCFFFGLVGVVDAARLRWSSADSCPRGSFRIARALHPESLAGAPLETPRAQRDCPPVHSPAPESRNAHRRPATRAAPSAYVRIFRNRRKALGKLLHKRTEPRRYCSSLVISDQDLRGATPDASPMTRQGGRRGILQK